MKVNFIFRYLPQLRHLLMLISTVSITSFSGSITAAGNKHWLPH